MARPNRETPRHTAAFETWYALGDGRTVSEVAKRCKVSIAAINNWRVAFSWDRRLETRDRIVSGLVADKAAIDEAQSRADHLKIIRASVVRFAESLQKGSALISASDFVNLAKLDQLLRGKSTDRTELDFTGPGMDRLIDALIAVVEREVSDPEIRARISLGFQDVAAGNA